MGTRCSPVALHPAYRSHLRPGFCALNEAGGFSKRVSIPHSQAGGPARPSSAERPDGTGRACKRGGGGWGSGLGKGEGENGRVAGRGRGKGKAAAAANIFTPTLGDPRTRLQPPPGTSCAIWSPSAGLHIVAAPSFALLGHSSGTQPPMPSRFPSRAAASR